MVKTGDNRFVNRSLCYYRYAETPGSWLREVAIGECADGAREGKGKPGGIWSGREDCHAQGKDVWMFVLTVPLTVPLAAPP